MDPIDACKASQLTDLVVLARLESSLGKLPFFMLAWATLMQLGLATVSVAVL